jgi:hypothetical protein
MPVTMRFSGRWVFFLLAMTLMIHPSFADWNPDMPYKWVQNPDLSPSGMDVYACEPWILADDFECNQPGPLTEIHLWTSWLFDYLPFGDPHQVRFVLSIHKDIPANENPNGPYSMPGPVEWYRVFQPGDFVARPWAENLEEGWFHPPEEFIPPPADTICWQYNFLIPESEAFHQVGSPDEPIIYWLDVQAFVWDPEAQFGWKTSVDHFNDTAVWTQGFEPYDGIWWDMYYPMGHEYFGYNIDLAFVITGESVPSDFDWGDAPDTYQTSMALNGPNHFVQPGFHLGYLIDAEANGQPSADAMGDDNNNLADEDGVLSGSDLIPGQVATVVIRASANGFLDGWIDYNGDGSFIEPGDLLWPMSQPLVAGLNTLNFNVPAGASSGIQSYARLRFSSTGGLNFDGPAPDGEVEDYLVDLGEVDEWKWSQYPDIGVTGIDICTQDPFLLADDFLCSEPGFINEIQIWGSWLNDWIPFGEWPEGVMFTLSFHKDIPAWENPDGFSIPGEVLWLHDFAPGDFIAEIWQDDLMEGWMWPPDDYFWPGDHVCWRYQFQIPEGEQFFQEGTPEYPVVYWLDVQAHAEDPDAFFGWKTSWDHWNDDAVWGMGMEPYTGPWNELIYPPNHEWAGESIDLAFRLASVPVEINYDFGDAPDPTYPTLLISDGARHRVPVNPQLYLGYSVDVEWDGQPSPDAMLDDATGIDDEDGVIFLTWLSPGGDAQIEVVMSADGNLDAWIDFAGDGSWAEAGDHIFPNLHLSAGTHVLGFPVPETGLDEHETYARFRVRTSTATLNYFGEALDGEVEDYRVHIEADASGSEGQVPEHFGLDQNLPNPFNPWTKIAFDVPAGGGDLRLEIFDSVGRRVAVLLDEYRDGGRYFVVWKGKDDTGQQLSSGVYHCRFSAGEYRETRKMVMLR